MPIQGLPGFRDFYPEEFALRAHIFGAMRRVALRYGFEEYDGPPLEALDLYTQKSGEEIVGQLYTFTDRGGRAVALRPEMTPTLARMVAPRANGLKKPIKWFSIPQLFRYERQQRGRLREHFQLNCDIVGEPGPLGDAEVIALAIDVMRELGLKDTDVRVRVSDRRLLTTLLAGIGLDEASLPAVFSAVDKIKLSERDRAKAHLLGTGLSEQQASRVLEMVVMTDLPDIESALEFPWRDRLQPGRPTARQAAEPLRGCLDALQSMGLGSWVDIDLKIVRGLAYYTGTVFELFDANRSLRAICGGGRYDNLLASVGGVDLPALGFGMGDVVLGELLKDRGLLPQPTPSIEVFVAAVTVEDRSAVLALGHQLRGQGIRAEYALADQPVSKQLKLADARRARYAVIIGPDDRARSTVALKDLGSGEQRTVPEAGLIPALKQALGGTNRATPASKDLA